MNRRYCFLADLTPAVMIAAEGYMTAVWFHVFVLPVLPHLSVQIFSTADCTMDVPVLVFQRVVHLLLHDPF